jgi:hypothetical protein
MAPKFSENIKMNRKKEKKVIMSMISLGLDSNNELQKLQVTK